LSGAKAASIFNFDIALPPMALNIPVLARSVVIKREREYLGRVLMAFELVLLSLLPALRIILHSMFG
jgi:hypothetical protein